MKKVNIPGCCLRLFLVGLIVFSGTATAYCGSPREFYLLKIYQLKSREQEARVDRFLQNAWLPAMHRVGFAKIGIFKPLGNDTSAIRQIYVWIPFTSLDQFVNLPEVLEKDKQYSADGKDYLDAPYNDPPYLRIESILLQAFEDMPHFGSPDLKSPARERIYELRSYEGATEKIHSNKLQMFNLGGEIPLFQRLGFNAMFYAEVISGGHMPNLMYMTCFENMASHDQHWKSFGADPEWKRLSSMPIYQNNVSHSNIFLLHPTDYSDF